MNTRLTNIPPPHEHRRARRDTRRIFLFVLLAYALTSPGDLIGDTETRWRLAERIVHTRQIHLAEPDTTTVNDHQLPGGVLAVRGQRDRWYAWYGIGQSLTLIPFVCAGDALAATDLPGVRGSSGSRLAGQFLASLLLFPLFGALWAVVVQRFSFDLTHSARTARRVALASAFASLAWPHTVTSYESSQVGFLATAATWCAWKSIAHHKLKSLHLMFVAMGLAMLFRPTAAVILIPIGLAALYADLHATPVERRGQRFRSWLIAGTLDLLPFLLAIAAYNHARFGSILETGYRAATAAQGFGDRLFDHSVLLGVTGMLFSPGKSIFLYCPLLLLTIPGGVWLARRSPWLASAIAGSTAAALLFFGRVAYWAGDVAWGPRYLAPLSGLLVLGLIPILSRPRLPRPVVVLIALSIAIQGGGIAYNQALEFAQRPQHGLNPDSYTWQPSESHLLLRAQNLARHATGQPTHAAPDGTPLTQLHALHIFPFKYRTVSGGNALWLGLLGIWLAGIATLTLVALSWQKALRRSAGTSQAQTHAHSTT